MYLLVAFGTILCRWEICGLQKSGKAGFSEAGSIRIIAKRKNVIVISGLCFTAINAQE
jgi:hypothetical protein